jgi:peptidoglycan-associated lipoprotein
MANSLILSTLGTAINTPGDEETPFYRDGKLYFSSNGYPTMGGLDVFSSTWNGSEWSKPQNMGFGYNSPADDMYFSIDDKGYNGFVVSNRTGTNSIKSKTCCDDIWQITITPPVVDLKALTFEKDKALNGTTLQLVEMTGGAMGKTESKTNTAANLFNFPLNFEYSYAILTNKEGYYPDTTYFNTQGLSKTTTINKEIRLRPLPPPQPITVYDTIEIAINEPIRLENIYYDYDKWDILPDAAEELRFMDTLMKTYPDMVIELSSHTDSRGNDPYNMTLSQKRAESAKNYLVSQGVNADRIRAVGYGESVILNQCANGVECTDEEHRFNRRTEFKIVAGPTSIKMVKREVKSKVIPAPGSKAPAPKTGGKTGGGDSVKQQKGASITFDKNSIDFGKFKRGEERKHIFTFTNNGTEDVEVDIVSACDCTEVDWTRSPVKPGESGKIEMTFYSERLKDDELGEVDRELTIVLKNTHPVSGYPLVYETKFHAVVTK